MQPAFPAVAILLIGPALSPAAHLTQPAADAFGSYVTNLEARLARARVAPDPGTDRASELLAGAVRIEPVNGGSWEVGGGLLHHWRAAALVPGAGLNDVLALLRDYRHLPRYYAPEVVSAQALTDGGRKAVAMRFKKRQIITIVLDAEFATESGLAGSSRRYSFSRSTHIWQVDEPGTAQERRRAEGEDEALSRSWGIRC